MNCRQWLVTLGMIEYRIIMPACRKNRHCVYLMMQLGYSLDTVDTHYEICNIYLNTSAVTSDNSMSNFNVVFIVNIVPKVSSPLYLLSSQECQVHFGWSFMIFTILSLKCILWTLLKRWSGSLTWINTCIAKQTHSQLNSPVYECILKAKWLLCRSFVFLIVL